MIFSSLLENYDIAKFADDNTPYVTRDNISSVVKLLEKVACAIFQWFRDNEMKANADKCHVLLNISNGLTVKTNEVQTKNSQWEKVLGIAIDNDLKFEGRINNIASAKIIALSRIAPYMDLPKRNQIMDAFFKSRFSCSPLTWMMHDKKPINKINRLHERYLRVTYNDGISSIELCKVFNDICLDIMKEVFLLSTSANYDIRSRFTFTTRSVKTVYYETEYLSYLAP